MNPGIKNIAKSYIQAQNTAHISSLVILIIVILAVIGFIIAYLRVRKNKKVSNKIKNGTRFGIVGSVALLLILLAIPHPAMHNTRGNINVASTMNHDVKVLPKEAASYRTLLPTLRKAQKDKQHTATQTAAMLKARNLSVNAQKQEAFIMMNRQNLQKPAWYSYL